MGDDDLPPDPLTDTPIGEFADLGQMVGHSIASYRAELRGLGVAPDLVDIMCADFARFMFTNMHLSKLESVATACPPALAGPAGPAMLAQVLRMMGEARP